MDDLLITREKKIAAYILAYPFRVWGYGEEIGLEAVLELSEAAGDPAFFNFVHGLIEGWVCARPTIMASDHTAPGRVLLRIHEKTKDARFFNQAQLLANWHEQLSRPENHPGLHHPGNSTYAPLNFVDCMDMDAPFLCEFARVSGEQRYFDLAFRILSAQVGTLWNESKGLFYHVFDIEKRATNGAFWGRGNCWAFLGILGVLERIPVTHEGYRFLLTVFQKHARVLASLQDISGHWHTVMDDPETYLEPSIAAFLCHGFIKAVADHLLPGDYLQNASRALQAISTSVDESGLVRGGSCGTPPGDARHYNAIKTGGNFPWVQGPALLSFLIDWPTK